MMEYMSHPFPTMFKSSEAQPGQDGNVGGQKVVCTPEVSLYQYTSPEMGPTGVVPSSRPEEKSANAPDLGLLPLRISEAGSGASGAGSTSSTGGFQCGFCGKSFQQKNTFQNHLRSHREGEDPYQCDICGKTFAVPARLTRHYRTHTGEKPYQCEYCNKSFSVKENLSVHRRIHTKERPYKCEVCERAFEHSGKLHRHMRIHTGERPHRCNICQKTFIQSGQLVIHMRTHTGEKPYVCKVCNKGFTCSKQLKVHTRTHTGEKPYTCDICGKSFGYNHVLKLHQVAHYGEKVYKCTLCNGTFTSKKALETHIKTHSEGSVPNEPSSPVNMIDPSVLSPSSLSQTPQNSDKENRESSSDSEISSHNSPRTEPPKTPPSPTVIFTGPQGSSSQSRPPHPLPSQQFKMGSPSPTTYHRGPAGNATNGPNGFVNRDSSPSSGGASTCPTSKNGGQSSSLPYPMLPPGVKVCQDSESRTTFLYVTSKLPIPPLNVNGQSGQSNRSASPPPRHFSQIHSTALPTNNTKPSSSSYGGSSSNNANKVFGGLLSNGGIVGAGGSGKVINENGVQSDKRFLDSASLRDKKVLPFLEQFGYGLPKELSSQTSNGNSSYARNYERRSFERESRLCKDQVSILPISDSTSVLSPSRPHMRLDYSQRSPTDRNSRHSSDSLDRPVEIIEYNSTTNYTPGGVLALALTKGSKAVLQNGHSSSLRPVMTTPPRSNSPGDNYPLGLDFSRRSDDSPTRHSPASLSPRSTPGLSESAEDFSDDHTTQPGGTEQEMNNNIVPSGSKRSRSSSSGGGPRKRSSLILEKYAQENPAAPTPPSNESILSQRLRLSSVIQYAEKCS